MVRALGLLALLMLPVAAPAQESGRPSVPGVASASVLVLDFERLFSESAYGRRIARDIEAAGAVIARENRRIEAELTEEERALTERRAEMTPDAFRTLADAFDEKVQRLRREQDAKARRLGARGEAARRVFLDAAQPVLQALMEETGAQVVIERRMVFMSADRIDVTDPAIARIDAAIGEGDGLPPAPDETDRPPAPAPGPLAAPPEVDGD